MSVPRDRDSVPTDKDDTGLPPQTMAIVKEQLDQGFARLKQQTSDTDVFWAPKMPQIHRPVIIDDRSFGRGFSLGAILAYTRDDNGTWRPIAFYTRNNVPEFITLLAEKLGHRPWATRVPYTIAGQDVQVDPYLALVDQSETAADIVQVYRDCVDGQTVENWPPLSELLQHARAEWSFAKLRGSFTAAQTPMALWTLWLYGYTESYTADEPLLLRDSLVHYMDADQHLPLSPDGCDCARFPLCEHCVPERLRIVANSLKGPATHSGRSHGAQDAWQRLSTRISQLEQAVVETDEDPYDDSAMDQLIGEYDESQVMWNAALHAVLDEHWPGIVSNLNSLDDFVSKAAATATTTTGISLATARECLCRGPQDQSLAAGSVIIHAPGKTLAQAVDACLTDSGTCELCGSAATVKLCGPPPLKMIAVCASPDGCADLDLGVYDPIQCIHGTDPVRVEEYTGQYPCQLIVFRKRLGNALEG